MCGEGKTYNLKTKIKKCKNQIHYIMTSEEKDKESDETLIELRVHLENDVFDKLEKIKTFYGIKNKTEIIRFLITKEFRNIEKG